ncbi:MAG: class I SAM-dependent methyltransferase [Sedimentisphaerales bacterium]|nr:class I SAM-dependent methyltransferase [Sedimentisphaerales bacterium]
MIDSSDKPEAQESGAETTGAESSFDRAAQTWDDKPDRVELAAAVAEAMVHAVPLTRQMQIMDFGCGSGLIARALAGRVRSVVAADTSAEMLAVLESKAKTAGLENIQPLLLEARYESQAGVSYDAIVSSMVLHHIEDIPALLRQLAQWCRRGGWIALADLEPEDGTFHRNTRTVFHYGFDPAALASQLEGLGFVIRSMRTVHNIRRAPAEGAALRGYPVFLLIAEKTRPGGMSLGEG